MNNTDEFIRDYTTGCLAFLSVAIASQGDTTPPEKVLHELIAEVTKQSGPAEFYENTIPIMRKVCEWCIKKTETLPS
jgi:hypothetical protein